MSSGWAIMDLRYPYQANRLFISFADFCTYLEQYVPRKDKIHLYAWNTRTGVRVYVTQREYEQDKS